MQNTTTPTRREYAADRARIMRRQAACWRHLTLLAKFRDDANLTALIERVTAEVDAEKEQR
ncbi:hypothetical protein Rwratislav_31649 [Rhodococcus wratislaviensis IFP 2016]|nr:hypothetical protein Rwratislav_31649 [Rhodococcus wratislaviensis IFP 2016]